MTRGRAIAWAIGAIMLVRTLAWVAIAGCL